MKKGLPLIVFSIFIFLLSLPSCNQNKKQEVEAEVAVDTIYPLGFCTDSFAVVEGDLKNGELFTNLVCKLGSNADVANKLVEVSDSIFDPRKMRAGNHYHAYYSVDTLNQNDSLKYLAYAIDKINMIVFKCFEPYEAWRVEKQVDLVRQYADVIITSSLWNDMRSADISPLMIGKLSDIYAWTIDFFALQEGDRFQVIYDQKICDGEIIDIDSIYYAVFDHEGKIFPAIMYDTKDGGNLYWNEKGESMKKAFLKAPLQFKRISSGFSYRRKHPVTGQVRAHTGVDYAAPTGTPVMSIGDGTVISKGWGGGGGNTVKIRHNSIYTTAYLHLSRYANIKVGDRVRQGEVIGYVGMTGTATGPHLDFRVWKSGSPINPLTMESPSEEPIKPEYLPKLDSVQMKYKAIVDSMSRVKSSSDTLKDRSVRIKIQ